MHSLVHHLRWLVHLWLLAVQRLCLHLRLCLHMRRFMFLSLQLHLRLWAGHWQREWKSD